MAKVSNGKRTTRAGRVYWYKDGQLHRDDGPAVEEVKGWTSWFHEGKLHRDDGADEPSAMPYTGHKQWWQEGRLHRVTGPAVVWPDGREEWHLQGRELSAEEVEQHKAKLALKEKPEVSLRRKL